MVHLQTSIVHLIRGGGRSTHFDVMAGLLENGQVIDELRETVDVHQDGKSVVTPTYVNLSFNVIREPYNNKYRYILQLNSNIEVNTDIEVSGFDVLTATKQNPTDSDFKEWNTGGTENSIKILKGSKQSDHGEYMLYPAYELTGIKLTWDSDYQIKVNPQSYSNYIYNKPSKFTKYFT